MGIAQSLIAIVLGTAAPAAPVSARCVGTASRGIELRRRHNGGR
jgi:hypothetical protein